MVVPFVADISTNHAGMYKNIYIALAFAFWLPLSISRNPLKNKEPTNNSPLA